MVENGELRCPNCNAEVDPDLGEWMMRDGETRRFRCDECGWNFTVTARLEYEVGPYPPMKRAEMDAWKRLYELLDADRGHDISECREINGRIRLLTVDDLEVWVSSQGRIWTAWTVELTATNGVVKTVKPPVDPDLKSDEAAELAYGRIIDAIEHWQAWSGYAE